MTRLASVVLGCCAAACLPGAITHYAASLVPVASCAIRSGQADCQDPGDAGTTVHTSLSVESRDDATRVFLRQEIYVGTQDQGRLRVEDIREQVRPSSCQTRSTFRLDALHDDPGFGIRQQLHGVVEESNTVEGDPQQCGLNVPYGDLVRYQLTATEVTQP